MVLSFVKDTFIYDVILNGVDLSSYAMLGINMNLCETNSIGVHTRECIIGPQRCPLLAAMGIRLAGWSLAKKGFCFVRRHPDMVQYLVCIDGEGQVMLDGQWKPCWQAMAYITPARQFHAYLAKSNTPWWVAWVMLDPLVAPPSLHQPAFVTLRSVQAMPLQRILEGLYEDTTDLSRSAQVHHWLALLSLTLEQIGEPVGQNSRLRPLWQRVEASLQQSWDNEQLAGILGISGEHLRRLCQCELGISPMQHLTRLRMRHAQAMLGIRGLAVADIAAAVGYDNAFAFSAAFKRIVGQSPTEYRQSTR